MTNEHATSDPIGATALARGRDDGAAAASWYTIDDVDAAERVLRGIEDCDPLILDTFPAPDLSGQWAGEPGGPQVYAEILEDADMSDEEGDGFNDALDTYCDAFRDAASDAIATRAREVLAQYPVPVAVDVDGEFVDLDDPEDVAGVAVVVNEDGDAHTARPLAWCNSARISLDPDDDEITVSISTGDPRGAFTMTVRRVPADSDSQYAGRLVLHVPYAGMPLAHDTLSELHQGTYLIGGAS